MKNNKLFDVEEWKTLIGAIIMVFVFINSAILMFLFWYWAIKHIFKYL